MIELWKLFIMALLAPGMVLYIANIQDPTLYYPSATGLKGILKHKREYLVSIILIPGIVVSGMISLIGMAIIWAFLGDILPVTEDGGISK